MYPSGFETWVQVENMTRPLCGAHRPHHFRGVTTVVTQLLHLFQPHRAYFGQKDYQQVQVIRRMTRDLHIGTEIRVCPTVREPDGLAMSTRNLYLNAAQRQVALRIIRALRAGEALVRDGERDVGRILARMTGELGPDSDLRVDYLEIRDAATLDELAPGGELEPGNEVVLAVAARVGRARLIDNVLENPGSRIPINDR
jgi:pantoate--beta-alanine ligase